MAEETYALEQDQTKKTVIKILQAARNDKPMDLAPFTLFRGNDKERHLKYLVNVELDEDVAHLQRIVKRIVRYMENSDGYSLSQFLTEEDSDGFWYVWEVIFNKGVDRKICYLRFLKVRDILALGDIDA